MYTQAALNGFSGFLKKSTLKLGGKVIVGIREELKGRQWGEGRFSQNMHIHAHMKT